MYEESEGWADYGIAGVGVSNGGRALASQGMAGLAYAPDVGPVGSGSSGTYYPRDTTQDARALNYLGFMPDPALAEHVGTLGSQRADMNAQQGAWNPDFRDALRTFQGWAGIGVDGWIGPTGRRALAAKVAQKNANPSVIPIIPNIPNIPNVPNDILPNVGPVRPASATESSTGLYVGVGVAAVAAIGLGYFLLKD